MACILRVPSDEGAKGVVVFTTPERDRFLLSKGHGPAAYYTVLAAKGFVDADSGAVSRMPSSVHRRPS